MTAKKKHRQMDEPPKEEVNLPRKAGKVILEISENDQIMSLIDANTYKSKKYKKPDAILKCLALIAQGTKKNVACRTTGVPYQTYVKWIHQPWYNQVIELLKIEFDNQLDATLTGTAHNAIEGLNDRIENGEYYVDKEGNEKRKPMSGRDLGVTFATIFDRRQLLRNKPTSVSESKTTKDHLDAIATRFGEMAEKETVFEGEFTEVKDDE